MLYGAGNKNATITIGKNLNSADANFAAVVLVNHSQYIFVGLTSS